MLHVIDLYVTNKDLKVLRKRVAWLEQRIASRDVNAAGSGFDRGECSALRRLLSQVEDKGIYQTPYRETAEQRAARWVSEKAAPWSGIPLPSRAVAALQGKD